MYTSKYLCMWQGVCSHLSRWYPFQVVCARVHHLTCAFTHMQRIHGSMLDSLSVSMSLSVNVYESRSCPVISFPSALTLSLASTRTQVWAVVRARMRVGVKEKTQVGHAAKYAQPQKHIITCYSLYLLLPFLSFSLSLSQSFCGSSAVRNLMLSIIARAHAHTPARMPTTQFDRYTNICIPVPAHGPADG